MRDSVGANDQYNGVLEITIAPVRSLSFVLMVAVCRPTRDQNRLRFANKQTTTEMN